MFDLLQVNVYPYTLELRKPTNVLLYDTEDLFQILLWMKECYYCMTYWYIMINVQHILCWLYSRMLIYSLKWLGNQARKIKTDCCILWWEVYLYVHHNRERRGFHDFPRVCPYLEQLSWVTWCIFETCEIYNTSSSILHLSWILALHLSWLLAPFFFFIYVT